MSKTLLLLLTFISTTLSGHNLDSLLNMLDQNIHAQAIYTREREERLTNLKRKKLQYEHNPEQLYQLNKQLYEEYKTFVCDSAIHYLNKNIDLAEAVNNSYWEKESILLLSHLLSSSGMYLESYNWLMKVPRAGLETNLLPFYYSCYEHLYNELSLNTHDRKNESQYRETTLAYKDSLLTILNPESDEFLVLQEIIYLDGKEFEKAIALNDKRLSRVTFGTPEYAGVAFWRALIYRETKNMEDYQIWLALSSISDIQSAIKDNASLCMLADYLYETGNIDRAHNYIRQTLEDANFYNARLRSFQIAHIQSIIDKTYQAKSELQKNQLRAYLRMISVLTILLLAALGYIFRQMKKLTIARNNLQDANRQLHDLNKELNEMNTQLQKINMELSESNHIKEEYIGHFLSQCSTYIDKLESYRRMVTRQISAGKIAELLKATKSSDLMEKELEELYTNFDNTFLHLYPTFVEEFNDLLVDNERIVLKKGELMNTELRIFALIRLGIEDSSRIAEFLRYSVNTIYNYRAKVKNKAKVSRDDFENRVRKIGSFSD